MEREMVAMVKVILKRILILERIPSLKRILMKQQRQITT